MTAKQYPEGRVTAELDAALARAVQPFTGLPVGHDDAIPGTVLVAPAHALRRVSLSVYDPGNIRADLKPAAARELADLLIRATDEVERTDG